MSMFIQGVFYYRHAACMQPVYGGQSDVDIGLSAVCRLHAGCTSIVKYAYSVKVALHDSAQPVLNAARCRASRVLGLQD